MVISYYDLVGLSFLDYFPIYFTISFETWYIYFIGGMTHDTSFSFIASWLQPSWKLQSECRVFGGKIPAS